MIFLSDSCEMEFSNLRNHTQTGMKMLMIGRGALGRSESMVSGLN